MDIASSFEEMSETMKSLSVLVGLSANAGARFGKVQYVPNKFEPSAILAEAMFTLPDGTNSDAFSPRIRIGLGLVRGRTEPFMTVVDHGIDARLKLYRAAKGWMVATACRKRVWPWFYDLVRYAHGLASDDECHRPRTSAVESPESFVATALLILSRNSRGERWKPQDAAT
jgi:hypothetical protein